MMTWRALAVSITSTVAFSAMGCQGTLKVVDRERGATLRSSWSIDDSEELGRLPHGATLNFDAVSMPLLAREPYQSGGARHPSTLYTRYLLRWKMVTVGQA